MMWGGGHCRGLWRQPAREQTTSTLRLQAWTCCCAGLVRGGKRQRGEVTQDPRDKTQRLELRNMWSLTKGIQGLKGRGMIRGCVWCDRRKGTLARRRDRDLWWTAPAFLETPLLALDLNAREWERVSGVTEMDGLVTEGDKQRQEAI